MKKNILLIVAILFFSNVTQAQKTADFFEQSNEFLKGNVNAEGKINYAKLKKSPGELLYILANAKDLKIDAASKDTQIAFWINAYNLQLIKQILDDYPTRSVDFISDFFYRETTIAGIVITLADIEKKIKDVTADPGINFVLANGTNNAPRLMATAYLPETLTYQITYAVKSCINKPGFYKVNKENNAIELPRVFETRRKDFVTQYFNEIDFLNIFLDKKLDNKLKIVPGYNDLSLNEAN